MPKQIRTRREVRNRGEHKVTLVAEFAPFWEMRSGQRRSTVNHTKGDAERSERRGGIQPHPAHPSIPKIPVQTKEAHHSPSFNIIAITVQKPQSPTTNHP